MGVVLRWQMDLIRKRFKIYGFLNCLSLFVIMVVIVVGSRYLIWQIPDKQYFDLIFLVSIHILFADKVFTYSVDNYKKAVFYFNKLDRRALTTYYQLRWFVVYETVAIWVLLPCTVVSIQECFIFLLSLNILLYIQIQANRHLSLQHYTSYKTGMNIGLSIGLILCTKGYIPLLVLEDTSLIRIVILFLLCIYTFWKNYRSLNDYPSIDYYNYHRKENTQVVRTPQFLCSSKELLYIMRRHIWIDGLFIGMTGNFVYYTFLEGNTMDIFMISVFAWAGVFITLYLELMNGENNRLLPFYSIRNGYKLRLDKLKAEIQVSLFLFILIGAVQLLLLPVVAIVVSYLVAVIVFSISVLLCKTTFEKNGNRKQILAGKEMLKQMIVVIVSLIIITSVLEVNLPLV